MGPKAAKLMDVEQPSAMTRPGGQPDPDHDHGLQVGELHGRLEAFNDLKRLQEQVAPLTYAPGTPAFGKAVLL